MSTLDGFAPIVSKNAKVLILGSMPGSTSLAMQQYYGHPRNAFWPIMAALFAFGRELCYLERTQRLNDKGVAIWDVLEGCTRQGSLDNQIEMASIKINRFDSFFTEFPGIGHVFFNGAMAEKLYRKYSLPLLGHQFCSLQYRRLPSTSPTHASLNLAQKIEAWEIVKWSMLK